MVKRISALIIACLLTFGCCSCSFSGSDKIDVSKKQTDDVSSIMASYSVNSTKDDFIVMVQDLGGVYKELYDEKGIHIKFKGGFDQIFDKNGNRLSRENLNYGDTLEIQYSGKLTKNDPKTITAYKVIRIV
ncbi:MAG: hypothetical protein IJT03_09130 [Clostridia bacterium]|nr:hypothetical protein [Clostridia bacterium]